MKGYEKLMSKPFSIKTVIENNRHLFAVLLFVNASSCSSVFLTPHEAFVETMNRYVSSASTIDEISASKTGYQLASGKNFVSKESQNNGAILYHYAYLNTSQRYCKYHFLVEPESKVVVGWGFDTDINYAKYNCGRGG